MLTDKKEIVDAFNEGVDTFYAEFAGSEMMDKIHELFREMPVDYDSSTNMWLDFVEEIWVRIRKTPFIPNEENTIQETK